MQQKNKLIPALLVGAAAVVVSYILGYIPLHIGYNAGLVVRMIVRALLLGGGALICCMCIAKGKPNVALLIAIALAVGILDVALETWLLNVLVRASAYGILRMWTVLRLVIRFAFFFGGAAGILYTGKYETDASQGTGAYHSGGAGQGSGAYQSAGAYQGAGAYQNTGTYQGASTYQQYPQNGDVPGKGAATASLVLGIVGFFFAGVVLGIIGLCMASKAKQEGYVGGMRTAGFVLSLLSLILSAIATVAIACAMIAMM